MQNFLKLADIQRAIAALIKHPIDVHALTDIISEKPPISIQQRISIYQDAYSIRMINSLRDDFSRVEDKIGVEEFKKMAHKFLNENPSRYPNLAEFSGDFVNYIKNMSFELYELASIDWLEVLAFYSQEPESILSVEEIQSGIPFRLVKNTSLFFFQGTDENTISYRRSGRIVTEQISIEQLKLLEIFKSAKTVDEFSAAMENFIEDPIVIQQHISEWIKNKIIVCERITK